MDKKKEEALLKRWVSSEDGRLAMDILRKDFYDVPSFDDNALEMAKIGGEREVIEYLLSLQEGADV